MKAGHAPADYEYLPQTRDVYRFGFESAGALEFVNEYSGLAECTGCYIDFAELKHACPWKKNLTLREAHDEHVRQL